MKKVLIINAHQRYEGVSEGKLNQTMVQVATEFFEARGCEVLHTAIEAGYNPVEEVEKHVQADLIILQTPVYWFGAPWIHKKYLDEVFSTGLLTQKMLVDDGRSRADATQQYGTGGKLQGKHFMVSATWNAPKASFNDAQQWLFAGKNPGEIFFGIAMGYRFCGIDALPDFHCFDVVKNPQITDDIERYRQHLADVSAVL